MRNLNKLQRRLDCEKAFPMAAFRKFQKPGTQQHKGDGPLTLGFQALSF